DQCNIRIYLNYLDIIIPYNDTKSSHLYKKNSENGVIQIIKRNEEAENKIKDFLFYILRDELLKVNKNRMWNNELSYDLLLKCNPKMFLIKYGKALIDEGFEIRFKDKSKRISKASGNLSFKIINSNIDWLEVETIIVDENNVNDKILINFNDIKNGIIETEEGFIIINESDIELITKLYKFGLKNDGILKISKYNLYLINELYDKNIINKNNESSELRELYKKLNDFDNINKADLPINFNGNLRDYQKSGFYWLYFLYNYNLNGCLADDMGLGKTIQTLCLLQKLKEEKSILLNLLIAPVITLSNWELEINKFASRLNYLIHHGTNRINEAEKFLNYDLIITSYHTLKRDIEIFSKLNFNYIILDEAQYIKNSFSQVFKTVKVLKSKHRLSLTGTPIENNTLELWSQMEFLNPNLLGTIKSFKSRYTVPIEYKNDIRSKEELRKIIYPFILRRKKQDVAKDLPEKEEIVLYLEMKNDQKNIYLKAKNYYKMRINQIINSRGIKKSGIYIIDALLRLRQVALYPGIAKEDFQNISSCKMDQLRVMLEEIISENHKVLIFSQFVKILKIIQDFLNLKQYSYSYIDGTIKHRERAIKDFQEKEDNKIFLLSLKAGGVGINLTSADYVIIFDPWWNPAIENQAIDRAHRIGQTKKVIIYKYIVKNTIEEKILQLQDRKKVLINDLITEDNGLIKLLNKEDILTLFN
ncbi:MAG: DEAD/DEAH box helicase, partial [Spirochaetes bacterium]|nr:DEAD/DEAH box helicase [Spirochaetota bacterium]